MNESMKQTNRSNIPPNARQLFTVLTFQIHFPDVFFHDVKRGSGQTDVVRGFLNVFL